MAPIRKSRTVNKVFPSNDGANFQKSMQRKRKLSDMLGPQWRKEELEHFYEAYRKYGMDWKKVVAAVRNRSVEMMEALYMMKKEYLSLPEGVASVVGFVAMMTDHYCNMVGQDSDPESSDEGETPKKSQKLGNSRVETKISKEFRKKLRSHRETTSSKSDDLSILETKASGGAQPQTGEKRTSRFPVSFSKNVGGKKFVYPTRQSLKLNTDFDGASQKRSDSLPVSRLSNRRTGNVLSFPSWSGDRMGELPRGRAFLSGSEDAGTAVRKEIQKSDNDPAVNRQLNGMMEASGRTEEQNLEVKPGKIARHIAWRNSKKARDEGSDFASLHILADLSLKTAATATENDEGSEFAALHLLADLSLKTAATATENESTRNVKDKEDNLDEKYGLLETYDTTYPLDRLKPSGVDTKGNQAGYGDFVTKNFGKGDTNGISEIKEQYHSRLSRKKQKIFISKIPRAGVHTVTHLSESQEAEADLPGEVGSRCRKDLQKPQNLRYLNKNVSARRPYSSNSSFYDGTLNLKDILSNCLSNKQLRQWFIFEWFYSAVDYPWFAREEFMEYLKHYELQRVNDLVESRKGGGNALINSEYRKSNILLSLYS